MDVIELLLDASEKSEQLEFKSDRIPSIWIDGPIVITKDKGVKYELKVTNNFTMHYNRCTTLGPGGKFNIAFTGTKTVR